MAMSYCDARSRGFSGSLARVAICLQIPRAGKLTDAFVTGSIRPPNCRSASRATIDWVKPTRNEFSPGAGVQLGSGWHFECWPGQYTYRNKLVHCV
jgi:hypothetical protein